MDEAAPRTTTERNHRRVQDTEGTDAVRGRNGFRFEAIPDVLSEADRGKQDYGQSMLVSANTTCASPLRDLIARLNGTTGVPPVTCVLPTGLMTFALGVARDLGIPSMVFWCASAASLMAYMWMPELRKRGYVPLKDQSFLTNGYLDKTIIDWIPGVPPISLGDISCFVRTTDLDDIGLGLSEMPSTKAGALILNTFENLGTSKLRAAGASRAGQAPAAAADSSTSGVMGGWRGAASSMATGAVVGGGGATFRLVRSIPMLVQK